MSDKMNDNEELKLPEGSKSAKIVRGALQVVGGAIPFAGGVLSSIAGAWSEGEQEKVNRFGLYLNTTVSRFYETSNLYMAYLRQGAKPHPDRL